MTEQKFGGHLSVLNLFSLWNGCRHGSVLEESGPHVTAHTHTPWHHRRAIITLGVIFPFSVRNHSSSSLITGASCWLLCMAPEHTHHESLRIYSLTMC